MARRPVCNTTINYSLLPSPALYHPASTVARIDIIIIFFHCSHHYYSIFFAMVFVVFYFAYNEDAKV